MFQTIKKIIKQLVIDLHKDGQGWILLLISLGWFFSLGIRLTYPVILPQVSAEFEISYETAGTTLSLLWVCYAMLSIPGGALADKLGERLLLVGSLVIISGGVVAVGLAQSFLQFLVATALLGTGCGLFGTTGTTVLTDIYSSHDATAMSISQSSGSVGTVLLPFIAGSIAVATGWRFGLWYVIPGLAIVTAGLWVAVPKTTSSQIESREQSVGAIVGQIGSIITKRSVIFVLGGLTCVGFTFQGLTGFLPVYLIEVKNFSQEDASLLFGFFFTSMIFSKLASGPLAERYGRRLALTLFLLCSAPGLFILPFVDSTIAIAIAVWITGLVIGYTPVAMVAAIAAFPSDIKGSGFGIVRALFIGLGTLAPPFVGRLADRGAFNLALLYLGLILVVGIGFTLCIPDK
jgi:predicted MFS family arabinose efflux permease